MKRGITHAAVPVVLSVAAMSGCSKWNQSELDVERTCTQWREHVVYTSKRALNGGAGATEHHTANVWALEDGGRRDRPLTRTAAKLAHSTRAVLSPDGKRIAYLSARAVEGEGAGPMLVRNLWIMNTDGTDNRPLTRVLTYRNDALRPVFRPDGREILFISARPLNGEDRLSGTPVYNLWSVDVESGELRPITRLRAPGANTSSAVYSPDGGAIVYVSQRALSGGDEALETGSNNLWKLDLGTGEHEPLTRYDNGVDADSPLFTGDGAKLVFRSSRPLDMEEGAAEEEGEAKPGAYNLWVADADGRGMRPLTRLSAKAASVSDPALGPGGRWVAYSSSRHLDGSDSTTRYGSRNIWVAAIDGSESRPLTRITGGADAGHPAFSGDGEEVYYRSNRLLGEEGWINPGFNLWKVSLKEDPAGDPVSDLPVTREAEAPVDTARPSVSRECLDWDISVRRR